MNLRLLSQTSATVTLGWDPVPNAVEYRGTRKGYTKPDGTQRWSQAGPEATSMKFSRDEWYLVEALRLADSGRYPPLSTPIFPSTSRYPSEAI